MTADDLLAGPLGGIDVAHLAAEHRAACDELRRLDRIYPDFTAWGTPYMTCQDCGGEGTTPIIPLRPRSKDRP